MRPSRPRVVARLVAGLLLLAAALGVFAFRGLEARVESRFEGPLFGVPSRVYARPLVLAPGTDVGRVGAAEHLERLGYRPVDRPRVEPGEFHRSRRAWVIGQRAFAYPDRLEPGGAVTVRLDSRGRVASLRGADGRALDAVLLEPQLLSSLHGERLEDRRLVLLAEVPEHLVDAVLAIEDQRFFEHSGLDLRRVVGALLANARAGRVVQGGSTLTQQLVKNFYLTPERSLGRKLREIAMAWILERNHAKEEILEAYLNEIYLGQRGSVAIHGVGEAAHHYFGKTMAELELGESALLAGLIRGPSLYSPERHPEAARARRDLVLRVLLERGEISQDAFVAARDAPLRVRDPRASRRRAPYFVDFVIDRLEEEFRTEGLDREGLTVFTSLDARLQAAAEAAVARGLERIEARRRRLARDARRLQAALVALEPRTGDILAMVGGRDYGRSQFNRATDGLRQPGSAFKPVVALAALARGGSGRPPATLATLLEDEPLSVPTEEGRWEPTNYDERFRGPVRVREAIERSLNVPFARLGMQVGAHRVIDAARRLGIESRLRPVPSLALGSFEVTLLEMARAYAVFAAGGVRPDLRSTLSVLDAEGNLLIANRAEAVRVFGPDEVYLVTSALEGAVERGTGRSLRILGYRGPVAGKTGTTNEYRDAWFIGYTPDLVAGVWVGFDDGESVGMAGSRAALPIFADFLLAAVGPWGGLPFRPPPGLERWSIHPRSGLLASRDCVGEPEFFLVGTAPVERCRKFDRRAAKRLEAERERRLYEERHRRYVESLSPEQRRYYEQWRRVSERYRRSR
jgi:penicillin-binding protein 1B